MKRGLELVTMFNGLDREQLYFLLKKEFGNRNANKDIDRLLRMKVIMIKDDEILYMPDTEPNPDIREALRILQAFYNKRMNSFERGKSPVLLKFSKEIKGESCNFCVCKAENVSKLPMSEKNAMIIIIANNKQLRFPFLRSYLLAVKEYGRFNYYKPTEEDTEHEL